MEISNEVKFQILLQDLQIYLNTKYQLQTRYKVYKDLEKPEAVLKEIEDAVFENQQFIDKYETLLKEFEKAPKQKAE